MTRNDWHPQSTNLIDLLNRMILDLAGEVCHSLDTVTVKSGGNRRPPVMALMVLLISGVPIP